MKANRSPLTPSETNLIIQGSIENLDPQQILARDLLVKFNLENDERANEYVQMIGPELSAVLKEALIKAEDPRKAYYQFEWETGKVMLEFTVG